jgi:hypothetical protein
MRFTALRLFKLAKGYSLAIVLFVAGAIVFGLGAVIGSRFNGQPQPHFGLDIARAILTLGSGLILGGAVKVMLDGLQAAQKERQDEHELRERLLAELRDVHDRAENARLMIAAQRSAEAYNEQMRALIGCQVVLLKIKRTLDLRPGSTREVDRDGVSLASMIGYLRALQDEYGQNYCELADCQRYDEALTHRRLSALIEANSSFDPGTVAARHYAWGLMRDRKMFPVLDDLSKCGEQYTEKFRRQLECLAAQLLKPPSRQRGDQCVSRQSDDQFENQTSEVARQVRRAIQPGDSKQSNVSAS